MNDLKTGQGFFTVKMDRLKEITGYSLIELLIVMVLISVTALLTFSGTKSPESKIKKTAFGLKADMELAKMEAVKRNQNVWSSSQVTILIVSRYRVKEIVQKQ